MMAWERSKLLDDQYDDQTKPGSVLTATSMRWDNDLEDHLEHIGSGHDHRKISTLDS